MTGRYGNRRDDYPRSFRSRHNTRDDSRRGGFGSSGARGDYGPLLARELDSTYEEKVNRNYSNSIFVGNLTYDSTPEDLTEFFTDRKSSPRGYNYIKRAPQRYGYSRVH